MENKLNRPHGGELINRVVNGDRRLRELQKATELKKIKLDDVTTSIVEMIAIGALSPLTGFMCARDYHSVLRNMYLANDIVWTVPITLKVTKEFASKVKPGEKLALCEKNGQILGTIEVEDKFKIDQQLENQLVYQSKNPALHGSSRKSSEYKMALGGNIQLLNRPSSTCSSRYRYDPEQVRKIFADRGWSRIVAFQNPNPIGSSRESVEKCALDIVDGLFLHPQIIEYELSGPAVLHQIRKYVVLVQNYYPPDRIVFSIFPWARFHAGPREAVLQAIIRQNFGCSHFIIAEKNLDADDFFNILDLQRIFNEFPPEDLEITPILAEQTFYCKKCKAVVTAKICPHQNDPMEENRLNNGKTMLAKGSLPPLEFSSHDVFPILIDELWKVKPRNKIFTSNQNAVQFNPNLVQFLTG